MLFFEDTHSTVNIFLFNGKRRQQYWEQYFIYKKKLQNTLNNFHQQDIRQVFEVTDTV
jgi:hypothetical protein